MLPCKPSLRPQANTFCDGIWHAVLAVALVLLGVQTVHAQDQPILTVAIAGVDDPNNVPLGSEITVRCTLRGPAGEELFMLPDGRPVADLDWAVTLQRGPAPVFVDGNGNSVATAPSARGRLEQIGLYVFACIPADAADAAGLTQRPGVAVARAPEIATTRVLALRDDVDRPAGMFELGRPLRIVAAAFAEDAESPIALDAPQILVYRGRVSCDAVSLTPLGFEAFSIEDTAQWVRGTGHVAVYRPRQTGVFTFRVSLSGGQGATRCDAVTVEIAEEAIAPEISISFPPEGQLQWDQPVVPIEGSISKASERLRDVQVSNGHWSVAARLSDQDGQDRTRFFSDLPFAPGLNLITVTATDTGGNSRRAVRAVVIGRDYNSVHPFDDDAIMGRRELRLQAGRSLLVDARQPIDSLLELLQRAPALLDLAGYDLELGTEAVEETAVSDILPDPFTFTITSDVTGSVSPGRVSFGLDPRSDRLDVIVRAPLTGEIEVDTPVLSDSSVRIGGAVEVILPMRLTTAGGFSVVLTTDEIRVVDRLQLDIQSPSEDDVDAAVRPRILKTVEEKVKVLLTEIVGCTRHDDDPLSCRLDQVPEPPLRAIDTGGDLIEIGVELGGNWQDFGFSLPDPVNADRVLEGRIVLNVGNAGIANSRIDTTLSPSLRLRGSESDGAVEAAPNFLGGLLDLDIGATLDGTTRDLSDPDLLRVFGSGNRDLQGVIHLNLLNQVAAELFAAGVFQADLNLAETIAAADFFDTEMETAKAAIALIGSRLRLRLLAPPRLTHYGEAGGLFIESGPVEVEFDMTDRYDSKIVLRGGVIARANLASAQGGRAVQIALANPTGCSPSGTRFMECDGHFEIAVTQRTGLTNTGPTPSGLEPEQFQELLTGLGALTSDGQHRSDHEFDLFWRDLIAGLVGNILSDGFVVAPPAIPVPRVSLGDFQLRPLQVSGIGFHDRTDGDAGAGGWLAFEFDLGGGAEQPGTE